MGEEPPEGGLVLLMTCSPVAGPKEFPGLGDGEGEGDFISGGPSKMLLSRIEGGFRLDMNRKKRNNKSNSTCDGQAHKIHQLKQEQLYDVQ